MNVLTNPATGWEYVDVPPKVAAEYLGVSPTFVYAALKQGRLPIGSACKGTGGRWSYNIPVERLKAYANGLDVASAVEIIEQFAERLVKNGNS